MYVSVNKRSNIRRPVQYAALASGTTGDVVWSEEEEFSKIARRQVRVDIVRQPVPESRKNLAVASQ
jgi:hypothetical protein